MSIFGRVIYGNLINNLSKAVNAVPQLRNNFKFKKNMVEKDIKEILNQCFLKNGFENNKFLFNFRVNKIKVTVELGIYVLASLDGIFTYYFGLELGKCELKDPWKISEIDWLSQKKIKVIKKIFKYYNLGAPKHLLIESFY